MPTARGFVLLLIWGHVLSLNNNELKSVGIFGHYGNLNLGDEAIITAIIENVRLRFPDAELTCFSVNPQDSQMRYSVPAYPIRPLNAENGSAKGTNSESLRAREQTAPVNKKRGLKGKIIAQAKSWPLVRSMARLALAILAFMRHAPGEIAFTKDSLQHLFRLDILIIAGSNQFLDNFGGPWGFPYTLLRWSILARLAGVKLAYVSIGAGPLDARLSRFLCRTALKFSDYTTFRDKASQQIIWPRAKNGRSRVYPDLAFSLMQHKENSNVRQKVRVGINVMAMYDPRYWCKPDEQKYLKYVDNLATFAHRLIDDDLDLFFFGTQKKDEAVIDDLLKILRKKTGMPLPLAQYARYSDSVYGLLKVLAKADIVIATRFHGTVLSLFSAKPTLGVCYYRKSSDLLTASGQDEYWIDLDDLEPDDLYAKFNRLLAKKNREIEKIRATNRKNKIRLAEQYDALFASFQKI